ncbi:hypothetical protein BDN67DRAFT_828983 [Paxillus ammoniavirescens]|nr:hypothetical protein BDN67DRAFT_828983 [Paxillus ammoniavirescens]
MVSVHHFPKPPLAHPYFSRAFSVVVGTGFSDVWASSGRTIKTTNNARTSPTGLPQGTARGGNVGIVDVMSVARSRVYI